MKKYTSKQIFSIALPILISTLMEQLVGMTDAAFLGRVGEVELGASALGGILYISLFMLAVGFATGGQILMSRRNGEGNLQAIGNILPASGRAACRVLKLTATFTSLLT